MKGSRLRNLFIFLGLMLLALSAGLAQAQGPDIEEDQPQGGNAVAAILGDAIPIQGQLTDASGNPLAGDHSVTFSLYDDPAAGILLCSTNYSPLSLTNGLFNVTITGCSDTEISGQQLYLGIQIDADGEMIPRQPIYAVPYARSLRPGANIAGVVDSGSILALTNSSTVDGTKGLWVAADGASGVNYGVLARSSSPDGYAGWFANSAVDGVGLYARGGSSIAADLVLAGTASGGNDDDGRILSDPAYASSDIYLKSNDAILLDLDSDDNEDGDLEVRNSSDTTILKASENGNVHLGIDAGEVMTITVGDHFRDNAIVAWAKIEGGDPGSIQAEFGISSVDHYAVGRYKIYLDINAVSSGSLIPMVIAEIDTAPVGAANLRIVSINQLQPNIFNVYINDGNGNLVNNDFVFMVTAR
jgi:hypothetical protein